MSKKCKYIIKLADGTSFLEVPSNSLNPDNFDFKNSIINYLIREGLDPEVLLQQLASTSKELVVPEEVKSRVMGQTSLQKAI